MDPQWERHWSTICLGIVTITTAFVGTALFSADLADLTTRPQHPIGLVWLTYRVVTIVLILVVYLTMVSRATNAIFMTRFELAARRTTRREAARDVYFGMNIVIVGLLGLLFLQFVGEPGAAEIPAMMTPAGGD